MTSTATSKLRIGIPSKGRLADASVQLLHEAGLSFRRQPRSLFALCREMPVEIAFLRTDDIPVLCAEGAVDLGITGSDLVAEAQVDLTTRLSLGIGNCRLAVCVPEDSPIQSPRELDGRRIATSFPVLTQQFLSHHGAKARPVTLSGSVEIMVGLGVADAIVDLIETGSTLAANRLRELAEIGRYETVLVQNSQQRQPQLADRIVRRLEGVVIARAYSLLEYNVPRSKLQEAEAITPGFESPTVSTLENTEWCAIRVMVRRNEVIEIMERLEQLGATAILETRITNCRL